MGAGLSLKAQVAEFRKSEIPSLMLSTWDDRLEDWLQAVLLAGAVERYEEDPSLEDAWGTEGPRDDETIAEWTERRRTGVQSWCFPSDRVRSEYLGSVSSRSEADVLALLRLFLFEESCFGLDSEYLHQALYVQRDVTQAHLPVEYWRRVLAWIGGSVKPHPTIRWALDLLPSSPQQAIDAITGYLNVYRGVRPEGRSQGLLDAISIIRARWIDDLTAAADALFRLSPRQLEILVAALYRKLGYSVELTPVSRDGGRDVIARRVSPGRSETVEIECKAHTAPVGIEIARQLQGVVARSGASRGVLVTIGAFTRGTVETASDDNRLELIDGVTLVRLLNEVFGTLWYDDRAWICHGLA